MTSTVKNNTRWERMREKGLLRFVLVQGVLQWGVGTAVLWLILMSIFSGGQLDYGAVAPRAFLIFPSFGIAFGLILWFVLERHGRRA